MDLSILVCSLSTGAASLFYPVAVRGKSISKEEIRETIEIFSKRNYDRHLLQISLLVHTDGTNSTVNEANRLNATSNCSATPRRCSDVTLFNWSIVEIRARVADDRCSTAFGKNISFFNSFFAAVWLCDFLVVMWWRKI